MAGTSRAGPWARFQARALIRDGAVVVACCGAVDDMGLGKTLQMIALIVQDVETRLAAATLTGTPSSPECTLIVCPTSVLSHWSDEFKVLRALRNPHAPIPSIASFSLIRFP